MLRPLFQVCIALIFLCALRHHASADQWQSLNGESRFRVAYDEQSIRWTPEGRLEIRLRFIPLGEAQRKAAALEYQEKHYLSHLESYEIDCNEQTAILGVIDILGPSRQSIKQVKGSTQPFPIAPGSVLDNAAARMCPMPDAESDDDPEDGETGQGNNPGLITDNGTTGSHTDIQRENAAAQPTSAEAWKKLGNTYFDADQPEKAIDAYAHALAMRPDDTDVLNDQGAMFRQTGDFSRAVANFEKAFSLDPHNLESLYNGAYVYAFDLHNTPKALNMWRQYLTMDSTSDMAHQVRSFVDKYGK